MTLIVTPKNKKEEKVLKAFLTSLSIGFYTETEEEEALYKAMQKRRKTPLLSPKEKDSFIRQLSYRVFL